MYKVEKHILDSVTDVLDGFSKPVRAKNLKARLALEKKAAKLSQLIKDNYTKVKIIDENTNN